MDIDANPDDEKIIVNVKGVSAKAWDRAKNSSNKNGETLGQWITRAADQLANLETGQRIFPPDKMGANPISQQVKPVVHVDFHEVAAVLMAMKEAGLPVQKRIGIQVNALLHAKLKDCRPEQARGDAQKLIEANPG